MIIGLATFEHLPIRVGGLAEAVTSLGEALAKDNEVMVFMPSHGIHERDLIGEVKEYGHFKIRADETWPEVTVYKAIRKNVRLFLLSDNVMDHPDVYSPRDILIRKIVHFAEALPGAINLIMKNDEKKPEVIHINDWHCTLGGALAKKYFGIPLVYTIHRICRERVSCKELERAGIHELIREDCLEDDLLNLEAFGAVVCNALTTVSFSYLNEEWQSFFGKFFGKVTYVWNGMDYTFWDPGKLKEPQLAREERKKRFLRENVLPDGILFFYVGRFDMEQKGVDVMLSAIDLIMHGNIRGSRELKDSLRFVVLGAGDPGLEYFAREMASKYPEHVKVIIGYVKRETTREIYGAADFCLIPSNFEPFGLVQLEGMCMGCIPIGTRVGGIKDTVTNVDDLGDRATGKTVPPRDAEALAAGILQMARLYREDRELLEKIRSNGRPHVINNFNWDKAAERYKKVYVGAATMKIPFVDYGGPF